MNVVSIRGGKPCRHGSDKPLKDKQFVVVPEEVLRRWEAAMEELMAAEEALEAALDLDTANKPA